jgi:hypothetical protein
METCANNHMLNQFGKCSRCEDDPVDDKDPVSYDIEAGRILTERVGNCFEPPALK